MKKHILWTLYLPVIISFLASCKTEDTTPKETPAQPVAVEDFFRDPQRAGYRISPNGEMIIYRAPHKGRMNVFLQKLGDTTATPLTEETERSIYNAEWESDERIIYVKDIGGDENTHILSVKPNGSGLVDHTPFEKVQASVVDILEDRPNELLIQHNKRNAEIFDVYLLNTSTGESKLVAENPGNVTGWVTDHDGKIRAAITTEGVNASVLYRETENAKWKTILTTSFKESLTPVTFTFDNKNLFALSNLGRDKIALVEFDPVTGKEIKVIYENPEVDVASFDYSKKRKVITNVNYETDKNQRYVIDEEMKGILDKIQAQLSADYQFFIARKNKAEDKFLVFVNGDRYFGGYYFYDVKEDKLSKLADFKPWLKEENMAEMKPVTYTSRDGLTIHGYLTLPKGIEPKNLPVVINPHGGPWARDSWGYNSEVQFLANRGYAVFQMNFRGSTGYGRKFWEASFKQWGQRMQDDITDGTKWLIKEGIADSSRVAIYGASYGGYATLSGITKTPELYSCAVDYVGVSSLFTFMNTFPPYWEQYREMMHEMVGNPETDSLALASSSPLYHIDKIRCPLLVAQGANDPRVKKAESDQMVEALRKKGLSVEYIVKDNEGHGFYNQENQFEFYGAMEKFFETHLRRVVPEKKNM